MIKYFIIAIIIFVISFVICKVVISSKRNKEIRNKLNKLALENNLKIEKGKDCDYLLIGEKTIKVAICFIPSNSSVTINSRSTWCLRWGGKRYGRGYPNQRYVNEMVGFLKMKVKEDEKKVIILYKDTEKLLKYLNESEIATVEFGEVAYDYQVLSFLKIDDYFKEIL